MGESIDEGGGSLYLPRPSLSILTDTELYLAYLLIAIFDKFFPTNNSFRYDSPKISPEKFSHVQYLEGCLYAIPHNSAEPIYGPTPEWTVC